MPADADVDAGHDHHTPPDLLELFEVLEFQRLLDQPRLTVQGLMGPAAVEVAESSVVGRVYSRAEWGARAPRSITRLDDPAGVTWHYEGPRMGTFPHSSCATKVRGIQAFHMDGRGWSDIAYNMVVCPHGAIYVARGRDVRSAANGTTAGNSAHHAVCALVGQDDPHPAELFTGLDAARSYLRAGGTGSATKGHRDWKATSCPGDPIYRWHRDGDRPPSTTPTPAPPTAPEDEMFRPQPDAFHIGPAHSGLLWNLPADGKRGDQVNTSLADGRPDQRWRRVPHADGSISLLTRDGTLALDCPTPWGKASPVTVWDVHYGPEQRFFLDTIPGVPYTHLVRHVSGLHVAPAGGGYGDAPLVLWDVVDGPWYHHRFTHTV